MKLLLVLFVVFLCVVQAKENDLYFNAGLIGMSMDYREYDDNSQILDSEKSDISQIMGIELGVSYVLNAVDEDYSQFNFTYTRVTGTTDYVGAYIGSGAGYGSLTGTTYNTIVDFDVNYMYAMAIRNDFYLLMGAELGYRSWERILSETQVERYSWKYLAPTVGIEYRKNSFYLLFDMDYKYAISPIMTATGINGSFKLASANIFTTSVKADYQLNSLYSMYIAYVYENQEIKKSNILYDSNGKGFLEPDSTSNNKYIKFGFTFKY